jgi:hypothetical protein
VKELGKGGFSIVFRGTHRIDGCEYALKRTKSPVSDNKERNAWLQVRRTKMGQLGGGGAAAVAVEEAAAWFAKMLCNSTAAQQTQLLLLLGLARILQLKLMMYVASGN